MAVVLETSLSSIITNKRRVSALKSLGITTVRDLLTHYPFRVAKPYPVHTLSFAKVGESMAAVVQVRHVRVIRGSGRSPNRVEAIVEDVPHESGSDEDVPYESGSYDDGAYKDGGIANDVSYNDSSIANDSNGMHQTMLFDNVGSARLVFFSRNRGYTDWMAKRLQVDTQLVIAGTPNEFNNQLQFTHPDIIVTRYAHGAAAEADSPAQALARLMRPRPVYHANARISSEHIHDVIMNALQLLAQTSPEYGTRDVGTIAGNVDASAGKTDSTIGKTGTVAGKTDASAGDTNTAAGDAHVAAGDANITKVGTTGKSLPNAESLSLAEPRITAADLAHTLPDIIPEHIRQEEGLMHRSQAYLAMHNPDSREQFMQALATLRFEEALIAQTALISAREHSKQDSAWQCGNADADDVYCNLVHACIDSLPFALTQGQQNVIDTIVHDMANTHPMQRLLQGEVGSGKTIIALLAMLQAVGCGYQAVLVAPTQVLAEQHAHSIREMLARMQSGLQQRSELNQQATPAHSAVPGQIPVTLLTGGLKLAQRRRALAQAASGEPGIIVATHAAFSQHFQAPNLALVVIDEQHRFGVQQREVLRNLNERAPHMLVMTATPIPRTAAMTWFGDLDISWLTELPGGRKPVTTVVVPEADGATMGRMFAHIRARIDAGERAYIICPRIDAGIDSELDAGITELNTASVGQRAQSEHGPSRTMQLGSDELAEDAAGIGSEPDLDDSQEVRSQLPPMHAVFEIAERLQALPQFQGVSFATLTGRDDDETKTRVMQEFAAGQTPVLVATTVIEVGIDVPQASCIVIFDADRFGLSQLHQLRGRVGRGGTKSWAFMVSRAPAGSPAEERLRVIHDSNDGFEIAQADLEFRGAGDVLGDVQSGGQSSLKLLRVVKDAAIIRQARRYAEQLIAQDPQLHGATQLAGAVLDFMRGNEQYLTSN